jgi:hypothetical protein
MNIRAIKPVLPDYGVTITLSGPEAFTLQVILAEVQRENLYDDTLSLLVKLDYHLRQARINGKDFSDE